MSSCSPPKTCQAISRLLSDGTGTMGGLVGFGDGSAKRPAAQPVPLPKPRAATEGQKLILRLLGDANPIQRGEVVLHQKYPSRIEVAPFRSSWASV